jgi:glycosyltransferase involved in cell wall biosynthesis
VKTTLIVATLNEIDGMKAIMPQIRREWVDQIIIMDGGSTDGTIEWARENGYFVYVQQRKGFRHAYCETMPHVEGDWILTFSPDGNSRAEDIPALIAKMREGYDMVIASRYMPPAKSEDDDFLTGFGNWLFTRTVNVLLGGNYTDVMVIFRIYRKSLVQELGLDQDGPYEWVEKLFNTKVSWEPLLSARAAKRGLKVAEIPSPEPPRVGGERKLQVWRWGAAYYSQFLATVFWK